MYYISTNKEELELYNLIVSKDEKYDGVSTTKWASIIEHKDKNQYAILCNTKYEIDLPTIDTLDGWFDDYNLE